MEMKQTLCIVFCSNGLSAGIKCLSFYLDAFRTHTQICSKDKLYQGIENQLWLKIVQNGKSK